MAASKPEFKVFYAWQSDTPRAHNRDLIEIALTNAADRLNADDTVPYVVTVDKDTQGIPGLCDIPAEILQKIDAADAVVLDLTFVAQTSDEPRKYCPNPNVLFELGYAFHAIGHKRLICVMNEALGVAENTLFDINHRRWPIRYESPSEGVTKPRTVDNLTSALEDALRLAMTLGPRFEDVDHEIEFQKLSDEILKYWEANRPSEAMGPILFFSVRPERFQVRRWSDVDAIENLLRTLPVVRFTGRHFYAPNAAGTKAISWGLYNSDYGFTSWAITYSGLFWAAVALGAPNDYQRNNRDAEFDSKVFANEPRVPAGNWLNFFTARADIAEVFLFARSFASLLPPAEMLIISAEMTKLMNTVVATDNPHALMHCSLRCISPGVKFRQALTASELVSSWHEHCCDFLTELFGLYDFHGRRIKRPEFRKWLDGNELSASGSKA